MNFTVHNRELNVGHVQIMGVASSSVFLVGDNETIQLSSMYDTPPESYIVGSAVPFGSGRTI
ncbi:spore gernimation protein GerPD [Salinibacillus xinjiangensis]|uniref:Spore gernimation protein GerPD n=1 Tax=Salinibacillus xinjiangensis TaxID=1229268 RepID=A0A6G1X7Z9_9BACI|nr:spore gernimation protein GerPD [Salinibacillus xinjiangensis]MRG87036.1 spore gernimation protein GerPD [Salinibacillus xinjiangensis]